MSGCAHNAATGRWLLAQNTLPLGTPIYISTSRAGPEGVWGSMFIVFNDSTCMDFGFRSWDECRYVEKYLRRHLGWDKNEAA